MFSEKNIQRARFFATDAPLGAQYSEIDGKILLENYAPHSNLKWI